jgi:hypothetical protein
MPFFQENELYGIMLLVFFLIYVIYLIFYIIIYLIQLFILFGKFVVFFQKHIISFFFVYIQYCVFFTDCGGIDFTMLVVNVLLLNIFLYLAFSDIHALWYFLKKNKLLCITYVLINYYLGFFLMNLLVPYT